MVKSFFKGKLYIGINGIAVFNSVLMWENYTHGIKRSNSDGFTLELTCALKEILSYFC